MDYISKENKEKLISYIENEMSEKRRVHTYGVKKKAIELAKKYGCSIEKAEIASLFHDIFRGIDKTTLNELVKKYNLDSRYIDQPNLAHGKLAAIKMQEEYGVKDPDIINAVSFHTTGRSGMSLLEKIIFVSDAVEENRDYHDVDYYRDLVDKDLDQAAYEIVIATIMLVNFRGEALDNATLEAKEYFEQLIYGGNNG